MILPDAVVSMLGKALAFAALSCSNLQEGQHLEPFAYVQVKAGGEAEVQVFENFGEEQPGLAAAESLPVLELRKKDSHAWVFGHEGMSRERTASGVEVHVLVFDVWVREAPEEYTLLQRVQLLPEQGRLRLIGRPDVYYGGQVLSDEEEAPLVERILQSTRRQLGGLWEQWYVEPGEGDSP